MIAEQLEDMDAWLASCGEVRVPAKDMLIVLNNHGGHREGYCGLCEVVGWLERLKHKEGCRVVIALAKT